MISGIKRRPIRGPHRRIVLRLEGEDVLTCGHRVRARRSLSAAERRELEQRKCPVCFELARRSRELEAEARAV